MIYTKNSKIFKENFERLIRMALKAYDTDKALSARYSYIARRLVLAKKLKLEKNEKLLICKKCNTLLIPGKTAVVRLKMGLLQYTCSNCGETKKLGYDKRT